MESFDASHEPVRRSTGTPTPPGLPGHDVHFYTDERSLASLVARFLAAGFAAGQPGLVIATAAHRDAIATALLGQGLRTRELEAEGRLVMLDAAEVLGRIRVDGRPDGPRFRALIVPVLDRLVAGRSYFVIRSYAEVVDLMWREGDVDGAEALEGLWNDLAAQFAFTMLCGYDASRYARASDEAKRICAQHGHVIRAA